MNPVKFWRQVDWLTVFIVIILSFVGWANIYAAVFDAERQFDLVYFLSKVNAGKQLIFIAFAAVIAWVILLLDARFFSRFAYGIFGLSILSLIAVLIFGKEIAGAKAWFDFGLFKVQPAEFAKFATALALAKFVSRGSIKLERLSDLMQALGILGMPFFLILLENETGSALIFLSFGIMLYREGLPNSLVITILSVVIVLISTLLLLENLPSLLFWIMILSLSPLLLFYLRDLWYLIVSFGTKKKTQKKEMTDFILQTTLFTAFAAVAVWWKDLEIINPDPTQISFMNVESFKTFGKVLFVIWLFVAVAAGLLNKYRSEVFEKFFYSGVTAFLFMVSVIGADLFIKDVLHDYQQKRLQVLVNPDLDPRGVGYQVTQSKIAIGSGGLTGKGFLQGTQTKLDFVPDQSTDFIFCTIGEEYGWIGSIFVILLFITLLLRLVYLAERQKARFTRVYIYGVTGIVFVHFLVNIGMTIGLFPVIGIPLPFISYGGSSLWSFTILIFTAIKLDAHRKQDISSV
jgi:rod shape determining protein RodA